MHILAKRILKEQVAPVMEEMLTAKDGISDMKFKHAYAQACMAKELLECDIMLKKMGEYDSDAHKTSTYPSGTMNL